MTTVKLQFRAEHLDKKDFFGLGKSDPYLVIEKKTGGTENSTYQQIHKTEYIKKDCSPTWKPFHLTFDEENPDLKVKVYDWDKLSEHDFIGEFDTKLNDLLNRSEIKFDCIIREKKTGKIKNAGTIILEYCRPVVGMHPMKLSFLTKLETTTPKNLFLVLTERFQNDAKNDEEIYRTETIKTSVEGEGAWKLIETAVEDVKDTLHVQVFKYHQLSDPELFGDFLVELSTLLNAEAEFVDKNFELNRKGKKEKTGMVTLAICKCNLPTSMSSVPRESNPSIPPPPPPSTLPPPPSPPPPPPSETKKSQDQLQKTPNSSSNPKQPRPAKPALAPNMIDEILKKKLKPVQAAKDEESMPKPKIAKKPSVTNVLEITKKTKGFETSEEEKDQPQPRHVNSAPALMPPNMIDEILKKKLKPVQAAKDEKPKLAKKPSMKNVLEIMGTAKGFEASEEEEGNDEWGADLPPFSVTNPSKRMKLKDGPKMEITP